MQEKKKASAARIRANDKWNAKAYDRLVFRVPKGDKEKIDQAAEAAGQSTNAYLMQAVRERIGRDCGKTI